MGLICFREEVWGPDGEDWYGDSYTPPKREERLTKAEAKELKAVHAKVKAEMFRTLDEVFRAAASPQARESFVGDMGQTVYAEDVR